MRITGRTSPPRAALLRTRPRGVLGPCRAKGRSAAGAKGCALGPEVYNAARGTEIHGDPRAPMELRPAWLRDEDAASMLGEAVQELGQPAKPLTSARRRLP